MKAREPQFTSSQLKRLEKRFASLASAKTGGSLAVTKEDFCCQPEVSANVFVEAYIDRLLEQQPPDGSTAVGNGASEVGGTPKYKDTLTFDEFSQVLWVFSTSASRSEKEEVLEMLLEPDESGWVDRRSVFRIVKYMLPAAPDRALEGVVDDFSRTIGAQMHEKSRFGGDDRVPIDRFLRREDLLDRFTLHHM